MNVAVATVDVCFCQIMLQKSFWITEDKFSRLLRSYREFTIDLKKFASTDVNRFTSAPHV